MEQNFFDVARIAEGNGYTLSAVGILIVFFTLTIISVFVGLMPHFLTIIDKLSKNTTPTHNTLKQSSNDEIALAISAALNHKNK
ncbi:MAG: OadG family protein [Alphaproteobacteria bacterium]